MEAIRNALRDHLRPEFLNRLTGVIPFHPLGEESIREIIDKLLSQMNELMETRGITLELDPSAYDLLMREGYSPEMGARNMERAMEQWIGRPLAEMLLANGALTGRVVASAYEGGIALEVEGTNHHLNRQ